VGEAMDGVQATRMTQSLRPHVLIMDVTMPSLDGLETTRQILSKVPETNISDFDHARVGSDGSTNSGSRSAGIYIEIRPGGALVWAVREVSQGRTFLTPKASDIVLRGFLSVEKKGRSAADSEAALTPRENEILRLLAGGKANKEISAALGITVKTVETHRAKIMLKLNVHSIAELIHYALGED